VTTIIVITHGNLAQELIETAEMIFGHCEDIHAITLPRNKDSDSLVDEIQVILDAVPPESGVIFMTDMVGGSAFNAAMRFLKEGRRFLMTGVNLPMILDMLLSRDKSGFDQLKKQADENCQRYMAIFKGEN
jgi:mannose PTS system EIIA component